ncbi:MAG: hypothetical protein IPH63_08150 [Flavobacteriales bacterium]|nr:hypothetical protein [Flavobacteriales bacterium]
MNRSGRPIVAIDAPSGVGPEREASDNTDCIHATTTLVLEVPRLEMFLPETGPCFGRWEVIPTVWIRRRCDPARRRPELIGKGDVQDLLRVRPRSGQGHLRPCGAHCWFFGSFRCRRSGHARALCAAG